jgi:iron complex transport system substrate-binding protein
LLLSGLTACGPSSTPETEQGKTAEAYPLNITDSMNREVIIEQAPAKIISLSPAITEILFAIEAEDLLVGVSEYCDYPEAALEKPKMGDFTSPNLEIILESEPDVIFVAAGIQEDFVSRFTELGIKVVTLDAENIEQVLQNIELTGLITGRNVEAEELIRDLANRIKAVEEKIASTSETPTIFFEVWDNPLMTAGPGSFIHDLIERTGGINIAEDLPERFAEFNLELLFERDPDIYTLNDHAHTPEDVKTRTGYDQLKAVQNGHVYAIVDDLVTLPGPRTVEGLEQMAKIIHPEVF